ncbi:MAG: hypothetical protein ABIG03_03210 [Candidatus Eisenbacteria bacterium]
MECEYLGLHEAFESSWREDGVPLHWGHWNYAGHRVVAGALSDRLRSLLAREP